MKRFDIPQRSAEWFALRHGCVTASRAGDVMAFKKTGDKGERAERINYRVELMMEILTGLPADHYVSDDMQRGIDLEPDARAAYERATGEMVETVGFCLHESIEKYGASPDGLLGEDGMIQIKIPRITTFLKWLDDDVVPEEHRWQMVAEMDCAERKWSDFVAYCPEMPKNARLFIRRFQREEAKIIELRDGVKQFHYDLEAQIARIEKRMGPMARPLPVMPTKEDYGELGLTDEDLAVI